MSRLVFAPLLSTHSICSHNSGIHEDEFSERCEGLLELFHPSALWSLGNLEPSFSATTDTGPGSLAHDADKASKDTSSNSPPGQRSSAGAAPAIQQQQASSSSAAHDIGGSSNSALLLYAFKRPGVHDAPGRMIPAHAIGAPLSGSCDAGIPLPLTTTTKTNKATTKATKKKRGQAAQKENTE